MLWFLKIYLMTTVRNCAKNRLLSCIFSKWQITVGMQHSEGTVCTRHCISSPPSRTSRRTSYEFCKYIKERIGTKGCKNEITGMQVYAGATSKVRFLPAKKASLISKLVRMSSLLQYFPCSHNNFLNTYAAIWFYHLECQTQQATVSIKSLEGYIHFI